MNNKTYQLGYALSGGGAKGLAEIGIIKALEEAGYQPDIICGVSAGSVVGLLYADGNTPDEMFEMFENVEFTQYAKMHVPKMGFFQMDAFRKAIMKKVKARTFEQLQIPLRIVATDLNNQCSVVFDKGDIFKPLIASCSMPIMFSPILINGHYYADGGIMKNLPVSPIREECNKILAISVSGDINEPLEPSLIGIAKRAYQMMYKSTMSIDRQAADYIIEPDEIQDFGTWDVDKTSDLFHLGYEYTKNLLKQQKLLI